MAISILAIIAFLMNVMLRSTTEAVGLGMATSDMIGNVRAFSEQFDRDASAMVGPQDGVTGANGGGVLIILNKEIPNVAIPRGTGEDRRTVRSDQLVFIRSRGEDWPTAPSANNSFTPAFPTGCNYIKVWYGHALRTKSDGTDAQMASGTPDSYASGSGALGWPGPNELGSRWLLGRQALFLIPSPSTLNMDGAFYDAYDANPPDTFAGLPGTTGPGRLYMGLADLVQYDLDVVTSQGAMVGGAVSSHTNSTRRLWSTGITEAQYKQRAYDYTYGIKRLRANPVPTYTSADPLEFWQVGQSHPVMITGVSDFIVEFAADISTGSTNDGTPDGEVDIDTDGNVRWYSGIIDHLDGDGGTLPNVDTPPGTYLPYDNNPRDTSNTPLPHASAGFVWRHDQDSPGTGSNWPYLIRVRMRVHDASGRLQDGGVPGKWFEQVIKVRRP